MERKSLDPRPGDELGQYLESPPGGIVYWEVYQLTIILNMLIYPNFEQHQAVKYPTLSRIALDYLAIQGSATLCDSSERAFSGGGSITHVKQ
jgi:hypothetical protein